MIRTTLFPARFRSLGWILLILGCTLALLHAFTGFGEWRFFEFNIPKFPWSSDIGNLISPVPEDEPFIGSRKENFTNELIALLILIGGVLVAFTKERVEDEYLVYLRLSALVWAVYVNAAITAITLLLLFGFTFLYFMMFNLFALLLLFIARYHYLLRQMKTGGDEK
ncbi:MAG: hypothetical protein ABR572_00900 [Cryomorphaceae bacterium]